MVTLGLSALFGSLMALQAHAVQLFDPSVFGKPTSEPVKLLLDKKPGDIEPYVVWSDIRCGRYIAASVFYRKPVTIPDVKAALITVSMQVIFCPRWRVQG